MSKGDAHLWKVLTEKFEMLRAQALAGEALRVGHSALTVGRRLYGTAHPELAELLDKMAVLATAQGERGMARLLLGEALEMQEALGAPAAAARLSEMLGGAAWEAGDAQEALGFYEKAARWIMHEGGDDDPRLASVFNSMALLARQLESVGEAESHYLKALRVCEQRFGLEHPDVATVLNNLGVLYFERGDFVMAADAHTRALRIRSDAENVPATLLAQSLGNLAAVHHATGDLAEAEACYERAAQLLLAGDAPLDADALTILENYSGLLNATGRGRAAAQIQKRIAARARRDFPRS